MSRRIQKVSARNFETHKKKTIRFSKVTSIVGTNDSGKSSLIRLLEWILFNDPKGEEYITWGQSTCKGTLYLDGHTIVRKKLKGFNGYIVDGEKFPLGASFCKRIAEKFNVDREVNFQVQDDPHFWFHESGPQVSRKLNRIINLGAIDSTLSNLHREYKREKTRFSLTKERMRDGKDEKKALEWVNDFDNQLCLVEGLKEQRDKVIEETEGLQSSLEKIQEEVNQQSTSKQRLEDLSVACTIGQQVIDTEDQIADLAKLIRDIEKANRLKDISLPTGEGIESIAKKYGRVYQQEVEIRGILLEIEETEADICQNQKQLTKLEKRIKKQMKGRCPLCGREFNSSQSVRQTGTSGERSQRSDQQKKTGGKHKCDLSSK